MLVFVIAGFGIAAAMLAIGFRRETDEQSQIRRLQASQDGFRVRIEHLETDNASLKASKRAEMFLIRRYLPPDIQKAIQW